MATRAKRSPWTLEGSVESSSEPGVQHQVKRHRDGRLGCDCLAYRFKRGDKTCRHIHAYLAAGPLVPVAPGLGYSSAIRVVHAAQETFTVRRALAFGPVPEAR